MRSKLRQSFYQGDYNKIVEAFDSSPSSFPEKDLSILVGAFSILGRIIEAEGVLEKIDIDSQQTQWLESKFWMAIGKVRSGNFKEAKNQFQEIADAGVKSKVPEDKFWAAQSIVFFSAYVGDYQKTEAFSMQSLKWATTCANNYFRVLALDFLGQSQIYLGKVNSGLNILSQAIKLSRKEKWKNLHHQFELSQMILSVQYGANEQGIATLEKLVQSRAYEDSYSKGYLLLELARQRHLHGDFLGAHESLSEASKTVLKSGNRRQKIILHQRSAHFSLVSKNFAQAETNLQAAQQAIDSFVDKNFEVIQCDLNYRLLLAQGKNEKANKLKAEIILLSKNSSLAMNLRILRRRGWINAEPLGLEDLRADIIDSLHSKKPKEEIIKECLQSGLLYFLSDILELAHAEKSIFLNLSPGCLSFVSKDFITHNPSPLTVLQRKLLLAVAQGSSKAAIIKEVWGYEYHPLRHDNLIYSSINHLKSKFGAAEEWLVNSESRYALAPGVHFKVMGEEPKAKMAAPSIEIGDSALDSNLNFRQRKIISYLNGNEYIDLQECVKIFNVSPITASRDLSYLSQSKILARVGRARATKYKLATH